VKLEQLQYVLEIEKYQSISKAARYLYLTQPTLSGAINNLEKEIGVKLFDRIPGGVQVTEDGEAIIELIKQVLETCKQISNYSKQHEDLSGTVQIAVAQSYSYLFSELLLEFKKSYPKADLQLQILPPEKVIDTIIEGRVHIGLTLWKMYPEQTDDILTQKNLTYETFNEHKMMLYISPESSLANQDSVDIANLSEEPFITYSISQLNEINRKLRTAKDPLMITDIESLKKMIITGQVIALLPDTFVIHDLYYEHELIKLLPIESNNVFGTGRDYLIYPSNKKLTLLEQRTLELIRNIIV